MPDLSIPSPNILFRVGKAAPMQEEYKEKVLTFSCPANWLDYAIKQNDFITGDYLECVMGHKPYSLTLGNELTDLTGKPLGDNLLVTPYEDEKKCFLRYMPTILMPTICFYGIDVANRLKNKFGLFFNFDTYCKILNYQISESLILCISNMEMFEADLNQGIIKAVSCSSNKLTSNGFASSFSLKQPYIGKFVDYYKFNYGEEFLDNTCDMSAIFAKDKRYANQSEFRFVIKNIRFKQRLDVDNYNFKTNLLKVRLKNLHNYAELISPMEYSGIDFFPYSKDMFKFGKVKR